jgi:MHS family proline/betaine transporter-like MFS transporter
MSNETSSRARGGGLSPEPDRTHDGSGAGRRTLSGQDYEPADTAVSTETRRRVIAASFIGNFVEWFDYAVYGYLAVTIATVFFPESDPQTGLLLTFALFAISFLVRPLGGFVWGHIGDKVGRRTALSLSILIMSGATFCIALIPGYDTIGIWAPVLLLIIRVVQGFSASGEYAGASAFLVEYAPANKRGLYAAVVPASTAAGLLLGSLMAGLLTTLLATEAMHSWGWRLPFLLAAPMGLIGRYIRTKLEDTPVFRELAKEDQAVKAPVSSLFRNHWRQLLQAVGAVLLNAVGFYVILSYMPTYLSSELGLGETESFLATTIALLTYIGFIFLTIVLVQILLGAMLTLNDGTLPSFLAEMFPTRVRYSGFAVSFNLSNALFGGTAPFMATLLIAATANNLAPAWYLVGAAVISLIAVALSRETGNEPLRHE